MGDSISHSCYVKGCEVEAGFHHGWYDGHLAHSAGGVVLLRSQWRMDQVRHNTSRTRAASQAGPSRKRGVAPARLGERGAAAKLRCAGTGSNRHGGKKAVDTINQDNAAYDTQTTATAQRKGLSSLAPRLPRGPYVFRGFGVDIVYVGACLLVALTIHEASQPWSRPCSGPDAEKDGALSLNPLPSDPLARSRS